MYKINYPIISENIVSIKSAEFNFKDLTTSRPVLDEEGAVISIGFAIHFLPLIM